jgi:hypothetical protein
MPFKNKFFEEVDLSIHKPSPRIKAKFEREDKVKKLLTKHNIRNEKFDDKKHKELLDEGLVKVKNGMARWTPEGRMAVKATMDADMAAARKAGTPWPPSPTYFRDLRKI